MTKYVCENCLHWSFEAESGSYKIGDCHRYPPTVIATSDYGDCDIAFPQVGATQWCGEWAARD
jgi:hypothetical protein